MRGSSLNVISIPKDARVYVAGHTGLVGSAILRKLSAVGFSNLMTATRSSRAGEKRMMHWVGPNRCEVLRHCYDRRL